ncbi:MAG: hypothetical protein GDA56_00860 [Hormoscilla sp. GM7CHS1pb]|nr:hypothetical protein [Hormoscilla sp. GM7CHS1pb]
MLRTFFDERGLAAKYANRRLTGETALALPRFWLHADAIANDGYLTRTAS